MLKRAERYEDLIGLEKLADFSRTRINRGKFPQITLYHGEEGTGKTSLMFINAMALTCLSHVKPCYECENCKENLDLLVGKGQSSSTVQMLRMSVEGGKDAAQESIQHLNTNFIRGSAKVVIYEECHRMDDKAQDVLLSPIEFLPKGVYVMFGTTDILRINPALLSRMIPLPVDKPNRTNMVKILKRDAARRKIKTNSDAVFEMIASWADDKPRAALQVLEAIGDEGSLDYETVRDFVSYLDVKSIIPIITNLNDSVLKGMNAILELPLTRKSQDQLAELLIEAIKIKRAGRANKISKEDVRLLNEALQTVDENRIVEFLYDVAGLKEFTRAGLISAFLKGHPSKEKLTVHNDDIRKQELDHQSRIEVKLDEAQEKPKYQSIEQMMNNGRSLK